MTFYNVYLARTTWLTMHVEADSEEAAIDEAYAEAPGFSAHESGWGSFGKWSADAGEWTALDEFCEDYTVGAYGPVVEEVEEHRKGERW